MMASLLPLGIDEIIALASLILAILFPQVSFLSSLQGLAIIYLFMCIIFRKYEAIRQKYDKKH